MKNLKLISFLFLIIFLQIGNILSASFSDNAFVYCKVNLEKSANQDILGLVKDILDKKSGDSMKNDVVMKAISMVSLKDIKGYAFADNKKEQSDYLLIIDLAAKFSMQVAGRTIEIEVKDKDSLANARMAALEKLLKQVLGGDEKVKSVEILQNKIFFNEEKENRGKLASFVLMPGKVVLASNKMLIRSFLKEGLKGGEKIEKFEEIAKKIPLQNGMLILFDNKNGEVSKFVQKLAAKKNVQVSDFWAQIIKAGFSFEQIGPEKIKGNLIAQVPQKLTEVVEKEMQSLIKYENLKIKKENNPKSDNMFISADFTCNRDSIEKLLSL